MFNAVYRRKLNENELEAIKTSCGARGNPEFQISNRTNSQTQTISIHTLSSMLTDLSLLFDSPKMTGSQLDFKFQIVSREFGGDDERVFVLYNGKHDVYDSGNMLTMVYRRNENEPDAVENKIIDYDETKGDSDKEKYIWQVFDDVFPSVSFFYPTVTRITLKTVEGKLTHTITEGVDDVDDYLPIPPHLSHISTVPLAEIRKVETMDMDVDRVKWNGQTYAFKKTGVYLDGTLKELTILDQLRDSPHIIDLTAIVINPDNTLRGFLMPYMNAGDLGNVFKKLRRGQGVGDDELAMDWSIKHTWACQIVQGVVELHAIAAYNGDLKPYNVVIGPEGQAILIDFTPMGFSNEFAPPELLAIEYDPDIVFELLLTGPRDIYSLGLVLYALAQEKATGIARVPVWSDGPGSAPGWYRDIVQRCLDIDPRARPSAVELLSILQAEHPLA